MNIDEEVIKAIAQHAAAEYMVVDAKGAHRECCGLVVVRKGRQRYVPCRNVADKNEHFVLHPEDYAAAEDMGEIVLVVHSHPNESPEPSQADKVSCEAFGLPWLIMNWPTGRWVQFAPNGYKAPLVGRVFAHGILDCYSLVRDYYRERCAIELPEYERPDEWWLKGHDLYRQHFEEAGFVVLREQPLKPHDAFLMQVGAAIPNHAAVYVGENYILHHQMGRLSSKDVYGGWYQNITTHHLRHRSLV